MVFKTEILKPHEIKQVPRYQNLKFKDRDAIDNNGSDEPIDLKYIQMRLPIYKITNKFEALILDKLKNNIIRAKIRKAKEEDLNTIMKIYNRSWMTSNTPFAPITVDKLKKIYKFPKTEILIACVYGIDVGFIILEFEGLNNEYGITLAMGILPRFQRKGIGTILGVASWEFFRGNLIKEIRAEVYFENIRSYLFLKSLGFEEYGTNCYNK